MGKVQRRHGLVCQNIFSYRLKHSDLHARCFLECPPWLCCWHCLWKISWQKKYWIRFINIIESTPLQPILWLNMSTIVLPLFTNFLIWLLTIHWRNISTIYNKTICRLIVERLGRRLKLSQKVFLFCWEILWVY